MSMYRSDVVHQVLLVRVVLIVRGQEQLLLSAWSLEEISRVVLRGRIERRVWRTVIVEESTSWVRERFLVGLEEELGVVFDFVLRHCSGLAYLKGTGQPFVVHFLRFN